MALLQTYVSLARIYQMSKMLEFGRLEDQLQILTNLGDIRKSPADISDEGKEGLLKEKEEADKSMNEIWQSKLQDDVMQNYDADRFAAEKIENLVDEVQMGITVMAEYGKMSVQEEVEEITVMLKKLNERPEVPYFGVEKTPDLYEKYNKG